MILAIIIITTLLPLYNGHPLDQKKLSFVEWCSTQVKLVLYT